MAITLSDGTTTVQINPDIYWPDEYDWQAVESTEERSITGALLVQTQAKVLGRPITLQPEDDHSGLTIKTTLDQIATWAAIPGKKLTLTLRSVAHIVMFRHKDGAFTATPWIHYSDVLSDDDYYCTFRFTEIE